MMKISTIKKKILKSLSNMDFNEEIFLDVFKFQYENNEIYRNFCNSVGKDKEKVKSLYDIPLLPVRYFKLYEIKSCGYKPKLIFFSSGTSENLKSKSFYYDIEFLNKSILTSFEYFLLPDNPKANFYIFFEPFEIRRNSSLSYMLSLVAKNFSKDYFFIYSRKNYEETFKKLSGEKHKVLILGTTISIYDFIIFLKEKNKRLRLAEGSRIMDTGGWKTKRVHLNENSLLKIYSDYFGISKHFVVNEYGMCELASQFYDINLRKFLLENKKIRYKFSLPFLRFKLINEENRSDKLGLIGIYDLFNIETCSFLLTPDMAVKKSKGFKIIERVDDELRGCSLIGEEILNS
ncbi:MAG: hypothetical protein ABDH49_06450 [Candidatus Hydrothermales bacterium]